MGFYRLMPDKNIFIDKIFKWVIDIVIVVVLALFFITYLGNRMNVVGNAMADKLQNKDEVFVDSLIYKLSSPKRYDVIAFEKEEKDGQNSKYIKRIVGLPGESIQIKDGRIYVNDKILDFNESQDNIVNAGLASEKITLEKNEYFVIGDNWNSSEDSRSSTVKNVKKNEIIGKVWSIVAPFKRIRLVN